MDRSQKADLVAELKNVFNETGVVVITRNLGLSVAQSTELRLKMRDAGAQFKVAKNRLAKIALEGTKYGSIGDMLTGPTALATSVDPVAAAKVAEVPRLELGIVRRERAQTERSQEPIPDDAHDRFPPVAGENRLR